MTPDVLEVRFTTDPGEALSALEGWLAADAAVRERLAGLIYGAARRDQPGRFWWVEEGGDLLAAAAQNSPDSATELVIEERRALGALASAMASMGPPIRSIRGVVSEVGYLARELAATSGGSVHLEHPRSGMEITSVRSPKLAAGQHRLAREDEAELLVRWMLQFDGETGTDPDEDFNRAVVENYTQRHRLHVWEADGEPVASTAVYDLVPGMARLVFVYTPTEQRGRGYAASLVAEVAEEVLASGSRCILYADPANATAHGLYERLGFEKFADLITVSLEAEGRT